MKQAWAHELTRRLKARASYRALAPALGIVLVLLVLFFGVPGVTPDSVSYLAAADGLRAGNGYVDVDGTPLAQFPPLYPTLIAAATLGVAPSAAAARLIGALAFGVVIAATGFLIQRVTDSPAYALLGATAVLVAPPLLTVSLHLWSEALFIAWVMLALVAAQHYLETPTTRNLLAIAIFAALAALTRYIGVSVVITAVVFVLTRGVPDARARARHAAMLAAFTLAPLGLWLLRNQVATSTLAGERYPSAAPIKDNVYALLDTFSGWFLPGDLPMMMRAAVVAVGAAGVVILAAVSSSGRRAIPPLVFLLVYSLALLFAAARIAADPIDDRLLAPLFAPAVVVLLVSAQRVVGWCRRYRFGRPAPIVAATLAAVWLITSGGGSVRIVRNHLMGRSGGYEAADWQRSETIARLRHGDVPAGLYANDPFAIRYLTGHEARLSPRRHAYQSPGSHVNDVPALLEMLAAAPNLYLVWFDASRRDFLLTPDELSAWFTLEPVLSLNDGTVYRITERLRQ